VELPFELFAGSDQQKMSIVSCLFHIQKIVLFSVAERLSRQARVVCFSCFHDGYYLSRAKLPLRKINSGTLLLINRLYPFHLQPIPAMKELEIAGNTKKCLECGEPLGAGRDDRKFCNDICRTAYNNRRRKEHPGRDQARAYGQNPAFDKVFSVLINNRNMLELHDLYVAEPYMLRDLLGKGFNLKYFTSEYAMDGVGVFRFCLDYGYHITESGKVYIIERPEEIR
jgi:hypothetical protein